MSSRLQTRRSKLLIFVLRKKAASGRDLIGLVGARWLSLPFNSGGLIK
jgi:hypothetical protein